MTSRSLRPHVVEEVQEVSVRDVPATNPKVGTAALAQPRTAMSPFVGGTRNMQEGEAYSYQPFASSAPQAVPRPASRPARAAVIAPEESFESSGQAPSPGIHTAPNGYVTITLNANNAAGFSYLFGWLSGIFFYFTERTNRFVRFHAWQSILLTSLFTVVAVLLYVFVEWLTLTPHDTLAVVIGVLAAALVLLAMFLIWLYTLIAAWSGHYLRLPLLGRIAEHFAVPAQEHHQPAGAM